MATKAARHVIMMAVNADDNVYCEYAGHEVDVDVGDWDADYFVKSAKDSIGSESPIDVHRIIVGVVPPTIKAGRTNSVEAFKEEI